MKIFQTAKLNINSKEEETRKILKKKYSKYFYFIILLIILLIRKTSAQNVRDDKKHYFCNGYLFDSDYRLSVSDIGLLCNKLASDNRFFISIQKNIPFFSGKAEDSLYTRDTEELFFAKCRGLNNNICNYGFVISVYTEARKVRISAGTISKNIVTVQMRENIIQNIKQFLQMDRFYEAIARSVEILQSYLNSNNQNYNNNNNNNYRPSNIQPVQPPKHTSSGWGFFSVLFFIICPILCVCGAIYYFYNQQKEEEIRVSIQKTSYSASNVHNHLNQLESLLNSIKFNSPPCMNIDVCLICMQKIYVQNQIQGASAASNPYMPPNQYNNNFNNNNYNNNTNLEMNVINPYSDKSGPYYNNPNNQNNNFNNNNNYSNFSAPLIAQNSDPSNTRFACGHVYHSNCLSAHGIPNCLMCNDAYNSSLKILNTNSTQLVDEYNIKKLMAKIDSIYGSEVLKTYGETYPDEVHRYDTALGIGLVAVVGITAVAATAIVADSLMSNHGYQGYHNNGYASQQQYDQGYAQGFNQGNAAALQQPNNSYGNTYNAADEQNPDTAEGDY